MEANHLHIKSGVVDHTGGPYADVDAIKKALQDALKPDQPAVS